MGNSRSMRAMEIVCCGLFAALMAVGAAVKIMIPVGIFQVTFSLQLLFALMAGLLLGPKLGFLSVLVYLIEGLCGLPVFAHGGGPGYLAKPTFGFLIGFAAAAYIAGLLRDRFGKRGFARFIPAAAAGTTAYYICGLVYYSMMVNMILPAGREIGLKELIMVWFLSTAAPDYGLAVLAAFIAERMGPVLRGTGLWN